jgi:hypothetical protein
VRPDLLRHPVAVAAAAAIAVAVAGCTPGPAGRPAAVTASPGTTADVPATELPTFDPATTVGDYAPGFPRDLLAAPDGATVLASSARPRDDGLVDVTLNLSTPAAPQQVVDDLGARLRAAGFEDSGGSAATGLTAQAAFRRVTDGAEGPRVESLLVGVLDDGARRLATISGSVVAPG